jgi:hypothetical protein
MRNYPTDEYDLKDLARMNAPAWMVEQLKLNPVYTCWGPYEDSMGDKTAGWRAPIISSGWKDGKITLNDLNEVVNFYFQVERAQTACTACDESGYNPETKVISDTFYSFENRRLRWSDKITQEEVDHLWDKERLHQYKEKPTAAQVNRDENGRGMGHDGINRCYLIEFRAKSEGVWGYCPQCEGHCYTFTEPTAHLNLVVWLLHPRKGCSRGVEISYIEQADLPDVYAWLREAAARNAQRFSALNSL